MNIFKLLHIFFFAMMFCNTYAIAKYSTGLIIKCKQNNTNKQISYYLDRKFIGSGESGFKKIIQLISDVPNNSIVMFDGLSSFPTEVTIKNKKYENTLKNLKKSKKLLFASLKEKLFDMSQDNIEYIYVKYAGWEWYVNSKQLNSSGLSNVEIIRKITSTQRKIIVITIDGDVDHTLSLPSFPHLPEITNIENALKKEKSNFIMLFTCGYSPTFYNYEEDLRQRQAFARKKKILEDADKAMEPLPPLFKELQVDGSFTSATAFSAEINKILKKSKSAYSIQIITPFTQKLFMEFCEVDLYSAIKYYSCRYNFKITVKDNKIILQQTKP